MPKLLEHEVTAVYAGLRAATEHVDYQLSVHTPEGYACVGGIRSTGLSASMAIAEHVREELGAAGLRLEPRTAPSPEFTMPNIGERSERPYQRADLIDSDGDYGRIVCFCERVTRGEIRDALDGPLPAVDLDGLRRRTRAHMGRCQGFFCAAELADAAGGEARMSIDPVVIVGAGPAGLAAALELRRRGVGDVLVLEREALPGGIPRHAQHQGFGLRDLHRPLSGPSYARRYAELADGRGRRAAHRDDGHGLGARRAARAHRPRAGGSNSSPPRWCSPPAAASVRARHGSCRGPAPRA